MCVFNPISRPPEMMKEWGSPQIQFPLECLMLFRVFNIVWGTLFGAEVTSTTNDGDTVIWGTD